MDNLIKSVKTRYTNALFYALNRRPISDPRYQSSMSSNVKSHNLSSIIPAGGTPNPHSLSAPPRVRCKLNALKSSLFSFWEYVSCDATKFVAWDETNFDPWPPRTLPYSRSLWRNLVCFVDSLTPAKSLRLRHSHFRPRFTYVTY